MMQLPRDAHPESALDLFVRSMTQRRMMRVEPVYYVSKRDGATMLRIWWGCVLAWVFFTIAATFMFNSAALAPLIALVPAALFGWVQLEFIELQGLEQ